MLLETTQIYTTRHVMLTWCASKVPPQMIFPLRAHEAGSLQHANKTSQAEQGLSQSALEVTRVTPTDSLKYKRKQGQDLDLN